MKVLGPTITPKSYAHVSDTLKIDTRVLIKVVVIAMELENNGVESGTEI